MPCITLRVVPGWFTKCCGLAESRIRRHLHEHELYSIPSSPRDVRDDNVELLSIRFIHITKDFSAILD